VINQEWLERLYSGDCIGYDELEQADESSACDTRAACAWPIVDIGNGWELEIPEVVEGDGFSVFCRDTGAVSARFGSEPEAEFFALKNRGLTHGARSNFDICRPGQEVILHTDSVHGSPDYRAVYA
jgi:hypothetical protein